MMRFWIPCPCKDDHATGGPRPCAAEGDSYSRAETRPRHNETCSCELNGEIVAVESAPSHLYKCEGAQGTVFPYV